MEMSFFAAAAAATLDVSAVDDGVAAAALLAITAERDSALARVTALEKEREQWNVEKAEAAARDSSAQRVDETLALIEQQRQEMESLAQEVKELKSQPSGNILIYGSASVVHTLMSHDLVDQFNLMVYPVVLGRGKKLFPEGVSARMELQETQQFGDGIMLLIYRLSNSPNH